MPKYASRKRRKNNNQVNLNGKIIPVFIGAIIVILSITLIMLVPRTYYDIEVIDTSDRVKAIGIFNEIIVSIDGERTILVKIENSNETYLLGDGDINFRSDCLISFKLIVTINGTTMSPYIYSIEGGKDTTIVFYNITFSFLFEAQARTKTIYGISQAVDTVSIIIVITLLVFLGLLCMSYKIIDDDMKSYKEAYNSYKSGYLKLQNDYEDIERENKVFRDACKTCSYFRRSAEQGNNYPDEKTTPDQLDK